MAEKNIYNLELHEQYWDEKCQMSILRVAGGWIYQGWDEEKQESIDPVFVPFDNEFQQT